ncbi:MAG: calcium/proton exchanger [Anaerolineae bacterium]|nr:calcium/proton exchanger [Anaerolineae bacterium]
MVRKLLYAMLVFVPITLVLEFLLHGSVSPVAIFITSAIAIIPLADLIGHGTEELAIHVGPRFGGLLNATLGNAAELIITIFALREGLLDLVRASITGSILGNLLLVMGLSLLFGGLKNGVQVFDRRTAAMNATLCILAVVALLIPSLFDAAIAQDRAAELGLSEGVAVILIVLYVLYVIYGFTSRDKSVVRDPAVPEAIPDPAHPEESHKAKWSIRMALIVLSLATLGIVLMSEALVGSVEAVTANLGLTEFFIGIILIPLVGNVAEHLVAVQVAYKNKMELSMAVSLGSSLQIALFVAPVLVFISLLVNPAQPLLLVFNNFELVVLVGASALAAFIAQDGESNWLEGAMLLAVYVIIALAFFYLPQVGGAIPHP